MVALFVLGWWVGRGGASSSLYSNLDLFIEVLHKVEDNYVDRVEPAKLVDGALKGMLKELDPYSQYLDASSYTNLQAVTEGKFSGIGVVVSVRDNYPTVISPIEGSPAWQAGMHAGDMIVKIDGVPSAGYTVEEAATKLRGAEGTRVRLTLRAEGEEEEREVELVRREIETKSVPYAFATPDHVGYLRLANFSEKSGAEVKTALHRLRAAGARGLILDLRSNPGGLLDQAVDVAEQFLPKGTLVVYTHGRLKAQNQRFLASETQIEKGWPMVVLIDQGSASASEIVAGALQDRDRALVIGRTSFGKGSVQSVFPLKGRSAALKLTTSLYYTPSGRSIHRSERDSLPPEEEDEELEPIEPPIARAPDDTTGRPRFLTAAGRLVYGGGGITPDLMVTNDSLPPLALKIEERGLAFRFANRWVNSEKTPAPGDRFWNGFTEWITREKLEFDSAQLERERPVIERSLRRELARRMHGDSAAVRVVLAGDRVYGRAVEILKRAQRPGDVFAAASGATGSAPAEARATNRQRPAPARGGRR